VPRCLEERLSVFGLTLDEMKVLAVFLAIGLLIYSVIDCSRTPDAEVPASLSRVGWLLMIILLPFLGPVFWLISSRVEDGVGATDVDDSPGPAYGGSAGGTATRAPRPGSEHRQTSRRRGPVGPDDDPEFLRGL
jgi:phospholipase D-like protein